MSTAVSKDVLKSSAETIEKYARNLIGSDDRAKEFFVQVAIMGRRDPNIANCSPDSFIAAMMACVHLDLMPNTPEQLAYIIPYGKQAQFQIGYKGLLRLAYRSGEIRRVSAELVYEGDMFDYVLGMEPRLEHTPSLDVDRTDTKLITHAYAIIKLANGEILITVMTRKELDKIKDFAKASSTDAPWNKWYAEQARKTVLKRALKLAPTSIEDNRLTLATQYDSWAEARKLKFANGEIVEGDEQPKADAIAERRAKIEAAEAEVIKVQDDEFEPTVVTTEEPGDEPVEQDAA